MSDIEVKWGSDPGLLRSWQKQVGQEVKAGEKLAIVEPPSFSLLSPCSGTILELMVRNNTKINSNQLVCRLTTCQHSILTRDNICTICHIKIQDVSQYAPWVEPSNQKMKRRITEMQSVAGTQKQSLLNQSKLVLILDLDQTVLHATLLNEYKGALTSETIPEERDVFPFELPEGSRMLVKFRPYLREFLLGIYQKYEIHIYTMGKAEYANKIVQLVNDHILEGVDLQIKKQIIGGRIITRTHTEDETEMGLRMTGGSQYESILATKTKDVRHIADPSISVILDDSDVVWDKYINNLIQIHKFTYFTRADDLNKTLHAGHIASLPPSSQRFKRPAPHSYHRSIPVPSSSDTALEQKKSLFHPKNTMASNGTDNSACLNAMEDDSPAASIPVPKKAKNGETQPSDDIPHDISGPAIAPSERNDWNITSDNPDQPKPQSRDANGNKGRSDRLLDESDINESNSTSSVDSNPTIVDDQKILPTEPHTSHTADSSTPSTDNNVSSIDASLLPSFSATSTSHSSDILMPYGVKFRKSTNQKSILLSMLNVLSTIHSEFFQLPVNSPKRNVAEILPRFRKTILGGTVLCLSGIIPKLDPSSDNFERERDMAEHTKASIRKFGAEIVEELESENPKPTHLVSTSKLTQKAIKALNTPGIYCVNRKWLDHSMRDWNKKDEASYNFPDSNSFQLQRPIIHSIPIWQDDEISTTEHQIEVDVIQEEDEIDMESVFDDL